ncbi:acetyl-CoA carboxylase, partial [Sphingobium sp. C100]|uniref:acetyl-CoA carboxylase biotin carboxyl carrier protein n=1 Tax=Sphingobium sp. C100 TaxID=1207055 RepID=UPI0003D65589
AAAPAAVYAPAPVAAPAAAAAPVAATPAAADAALPSGTVVQSPIVGTAYLSAEPGAAPFARVGSQVKAGETVLIVEAMKVMNAIPAPVAGTVKAVLVDNGQPVEYDQPLIVIE